MNISSLLNTVKTINSYSSLTEELEKQQDYHVPFNNALIQSLKKITNLEVDYFTKCQKHGVVFILLRRLLQNAPSKTWRLLGKEIGPLLQNWLESVKKYLMMHCPQWWRFLKSILSFIIDLMPKDPTISDIILNNSAETLLDLACSPRLDVDQRLEMFVTLIEVTSKASKETLVNLYNPMSVHVTKLGRYILSPDVGTQWLSLELLIRWARRRSRACELLPDEAMDAFSQLRFDVFYKDARRMLNILNDSVAGMTSVPCNKVYIGDIEMDAPSEVYPLWLDISVAHSRLTLQLPHHSLLIVTRETSNSVKLHVVSKELTISICLATEPYILRGHLDVSNETGQVVKIFLDERHMEIIDKALGDVFRDKYEVESSSFSLPPRSKRSGVAVRPLNPVGWKSPSTASTSSLAQLHEKLASFPRLENKSWKERNEIKTISARPALSWVTEVSEIDDEIKRACGVSSHKWTNRNAKTSPSNDNIRPPKFPQLSPANSPNHLLSETIGPIEQSAISEALEENAFFDQLVSEVLKRDVLVDNGINTDKNGSHVDSSNTEVISNTPKCYVNTRRKKVSDERNFKNIGKEKSVGGVDDMLQFFDQDFLSLRDKECEDFTISPTLAKKVNASSSESSESFDQIIINNQKYDIDQLNEALNVNDTDYHRDASVSVSVAVINNINEIPNKIDFEVDECEVRVCLASMIDKVCNDKCLDEEIEAENEITKITTNKKMAPKKSNMPKIKLAFNKTVPRKRRVTAKTNKLDIETAEISDTIVGGKDNSNVISVNNQVAELGMATATVTKADNGSFDDSNTPLIVRRKRKLYSPKDDNDIQVLETTEIAPTVETKTTPTFYQEIERIRQNFIRRPRNRRSRSSLTLSPRSMKNNEIFDNLKYNIENERDVVLIDKTMLNKAMAVYNFMSGSSDEDFKENKSDIRNKSLKQTRKRGRPKQLETNKKESPKKRKKQVTAKPKRVVKAVENTLLVDERMRQASEVLNDSFVVGETRDLLTPKKRSCMKSDTPNLKVCTELSQAANLASTNLSPKVVIERAHISPMIQPVREMEPILETMDEIDNTVDGSKDIPKVKKKKLLTTKKHTKKTETVKGNENIKIKSMKNITKNSQENEIENTAERNAKILKIKKEKGIAKDNKASTQRTHEEFADELPPLIIEVQRHPKDDRSPPNLVENMKNLLVGDHNVDETNITHNLLFDGDDLNVSPDIHKEKKEGKKSRRETIHIKDCIHLGKSQKRPTETVDITSVNDLSEGSISTCDGNSPITARADLVEAPPSLEMLNQKFSSRNLDLQNVSEGALEYYEKLRDTIKYVSSETSVNSNQSKIRNMKSLNPVVSVERLSPEDLSKWLPSPRSSTTEGTQVTVINKNDKSGIDLAAQTQTTRMISRSSAKINKEDNTEKVNAKSKVVPEKQNEEDNFKTPSAKPAILKRPSKADISNTAMQSSSTRSEIIKHQLLSPKALNTGRKSSNSARKDFDDCVPNSLELSRNNSLISKTSTMRSVKPKTRKDTLTEKSVSSKVKQRELEDVSPPKKRRVDEERVQNWLESSTSRRHVATATEEDRFKYNDYIQKAIEKLDTSLLAIHQGTSDKLDHMFVQMEERQRKFQEEILAKCKEAHESLMSDSRDMAAKILREDCHQKRLLLTLLIQEMQDVRDHN